MELSLLINSYLASYLFPFARVGAVVATAPVFGSTMVPRRVRLWIAIMLTVFVAPLVETPDTRNMGMADLVLVVIAQFGIGLVIGFILRMVFSAFIYAGQVVAMQMGLGFASMVDPQNGQQTPIMGQFYLVIVTLLFLSLDGHLAVVHLVRDSFIYLPVGANGIASPIFLELALWGSRIFSWSIQIAITTMTSLLIVNLAFGITARSAPQLNVFAIGFPITLIMGFILLLLTITGIGNQGEEIMNSGFSYIGEALEASSDGR